MLKKVLAIETSCDDTSVALVDNDGLVLALLSASQDEDHALFGGIVPEIACRNHSFHLLSLIDQVMRGHVWESIDGIAVTNRPGLVGSLIVGIVTAKTLAQSKQKPFIGVNHLEGHLLAPFLKDNEYAPLFSLENNCIALAVSGGHSSLYKLSGFGSYSILGETRDDAAGEAFDKFAKMLGLGFPGGVKVDRLAQSGDSEAFIFPRGLIKEETFDFSFSGLKSSAQRLLDTMTKEEVEVQRENLCASFQKAICDVLIAKLDRAVNHLNYDHVFITGGVSANSSLRLRASEWAKQKGVELLMPPLRYCTDNAAMIGYAGILKMNRGEFSDLQLGPSPKSLSGDFNVYHQ